jgi:hypothetical protein
MFSAPTSAGILFSMLAAAGLGATWLFQKARVLAIFDDLATILLLVPLKIMLVGLKWQLLIVVVLIVLLLWAAWKYLHSLRWPIRWPFVLSYAVGITLLCESLYVGSKIIDAAVPIHLEGLLPAFALGCMLARPKGADPHVDDAREGTEEGPETPQEQRVPDLCRPGDCRVHRKESRQRLRLAHHRQRQDAIHPKFLYFRLSRHPSLLAFDDGLSQTHLSKESVCPTARRPACLGNATRIFLRRW